MILLYLTTRLVEIFERQEEYFDVHELVGIGLMRNPNLEKELGLVHLLQSQAGMQKCIKCLDEVRICGVVVVSVRVLWGFGWAATKVFSACQLFIRV